MARRRRLGPARRRFPTQILIDSFGLSLAALGCLLLAGAVELPGFEVLRLLTFGLVGLAPVAFLAGLLDTQLARAAVADLLVEWQSPAAPELGGLIAQALRDPSLTFTFWLPQYGAWADSAGRPVTLPVPNQDRGVTVIERRGEPVAALLHDPALRDQPELVSAVSAAAAVALDNARLETELRARLQDLQGSRMRVIEAAQRERARLERDLHDGAQQRLVALALELGMLSQTLDADPDTRARLERARAEVAVSLEELRDLARGIHPAVVSGHGLTVALESLAARAPVPLRLAAHAVPRLPERIEVAAYYVVCEGLENTAKHAAATCVRVDVELVDRVLVVQVTDDGIGGADAARGTGLRGLADRVEALNGRLRIWTPAGGGTGVRAEIPIGPAADQKPGPHPAGPPPSAALSAAATVGDMTTGTEPRAVPEQVPTGANGPVPRPLGAPRPRGRDPGRGLRSGPRSRSPSEPPSPSSWYLQGVGEAARSAGVTGTASGWSSPGASAQGPRRAGDRDRRRPRRRREPAAPGRLDDSRGRRRAGLAGAACIGSGTPRGSSASPRPGR